MSFDYDPYRHFDIIKVDPGWYQAMCHGCGTQVGSKYGATAPIGVFEQAIAQHVRNSHSRDEEDFANKGIY